VTGSRPRAASGFAAVVELRFLLAWRRLRAPGGTAEGVARVVLYAMAVPLGLVFAALVAAGSYRAARIGVGIQVAIPVSAIFFGLWQTWTAVSLMLSEREGLDLRRFLGYPLPLGRVWLFGLASSIAADPFALFWLLLLGGGLVGAAAARPGLWLVPLALDMALFAVATAALVALLQEILARLLRLRLARELAILAGVAGWLVLLGASRLPLRQVGAILGKAQWAFFPPALASLAARHLYAGRVGAALPSLALLLVAGGATGWIAWRLALRGVLSGEEGRAASPRAAASARPPWTDRLGPLLGKEVRYLVRHPVPRVSLLFMPLVAAALAWKVAPALPEEAAPVLRALPLFGLPALSYLVVQDLWLNSFGLDRGGARALFLAPLPADRLLLAKNGAMAALAAALLLASAVPWLLIAGRPPAWAFLAVLALQGALAPVLLGLGNLVAVLNPRPGTFSYQRGKGAAALSSLAGMGIFSAGTGLMAAPVILAVRLDDPWALAGGWAAIGLGAAAVYRRTLPLAGALLHRRREHLLAAVCGDDL
jgi:ABC-2 type transport system permease protein